jgi:hypothetical protein
VARPVQGARPIEPFHGRAKPDIGPHPAQQPCGVGARAAGISQALDVLDVARQPQRLVVGEAVCELIKLVEGPFVASTVQVLA